MKRSLSLKTIRISKYVNRNFVIMSVAKVVGHQIPKLVKSFALANATRDPARWTIRMMTPSVATKNVREAA